MNDKVDFREIISLFQDRYPDRDIKIVKDYDRELLYVDGKCQACITGYNLLHNTITLVETIKDELI